MKEEEYSASLSAWLDEGRFYFVMVESLLACKGVGLSEREAAVLDGVRRTHSQGHVLACFGDCHTWSIRAFRLCLKL